MALKRPFGKIRRADDSSPANKPRAETGDSDAPPVAVERGPPPQPGKAPKKNIYEALKKDDEPNERVSINLRPDLRRKKETKLPPKPPEDQPRHEEEPKQTDEQEGPRPTPILRGRKGFGLALRAPSREKVIVEDPQPDPADEAEASVSYKPDLKIKSLGYKPPQAERTASEEPDPEPVFTPPLPIELRNIKLDDAAPEISEAKAEKQAARAHTLSRILNLEMDLFEETCSLEPSSPYEVYINRFKAGSLKNASLQAFEEKGPQQTQTQPYQNAEFGNQCPEDFQHSTETVQTQSSESDSLTAFLLKIAPVIEELIRPSASITAPPTFLLAFRPSFRQFFRFPFPVLNYHSEDSGVGLLVIGDKIYACQAEIQSAICMGSRIIAGLKNCAIAVWDGTNDTRSLLYDEIFKITQSTNFELPCFVTSSFEKYSAHTSDSAVVGLVPGSGGSFWSLGESGKLIKWQIQQKADRSTQLRPSASLELSRLVARDTLVAFQLKERLEKYFIFQCSLFVNSSMGLLCMSEGEIAHTISTSGVRIRDFQLPKRPHLVYLVCDDATFRIYNESYSHYLVCVSLPVPIGGSLTAILLPEIQYQGKELYVLYHPYVVDSFANVYTFTVSERGLTHAQTNESDWADARESRDVIFRGSLLREETIERFKLYRNLNCEVEALPLGVSVAKTVPNMKKILAENRRFMADIQNQSYLCI